MILKLASTAMLATLALASPAAAGFWGPSYDAPVVYRPIVTPQVYYFQPAQVVEVLPPRHVRRAHACRQVARHHGQPRAMRRCR
ncbi:MAG: hypothetical protein J0H01_14000 [Rhizobiales bacterium]|nr:hypothetical protein [Hyphomicrobiales bacterium]